MPNDEHDYRLPRTAAPRRYGLTLAPDLEGGSFTGHEDVTIEVLEPTAELVVNAIELEIGSAAVTTTDGRRIEATVRLDEAAERAHFTFAETLPAGPATLHCSFTGTLNDKLRGFYRSRYTDAEGNERVIATTQMEATHARRSFPCWDEPDLKASFGVTLEVAAELMAVSNGPEVERTALPDGRISIRFADTMVMSTYLVAFIVGRLEATEPVDVDGVPLRIVHVPGKAHLTGFGLDVGKFSLQHFVDYYGIPYPDAKVDLVAVPDFAAGAMENLGCITFREALLLVDPASATMQEEMLVADVVAHELAHMWFGDLVTMRWWNGLWLNEAFATFMEVMACDAYRPDWQRWVAFGLERTAAFEVDGLQSTRAIEYPVNSPADAEGMFDVLTYQKGGALLRMLEQYLGEDRLRDGIRHYLTVHAYENTETGDLWDAIEAVTGDPVRKIMDSWIWQGGHPVVSASLSDDRTNIVLRQHRFLFDGDDDGREWAVPLIVRQSAGGASQIDKLLLDGPSTMIPSMSPEAVVVVNAGAHGFYRSRYDGPLLQRLASVATTELSASERYQLVDDTWAAVIAGLTGADEFCQFARGFAGETELSVWQLLLAGLRWCDRFLEGEARTRFQGFVRELLTPAVERLGWAPVPLERALDAELRGTLVRALALLGADPAAQARARALFDDPDVDPALAVAAVNVVAATGDASDFERIQARLQSASTPQEELRYLYALAEVSDPDLVDRTLELAMSGKVRSQNAPFLIGRCMASRDHGERAWRLVRTRWSEINARFPDTSIIRMLDPIKTLTKPEQYADTRAFFAEHPVPQAARTLDQLLERQGINVGLRERATPALLRTFAS